MDGTARPEVIVDVEFDRGLLFLVVRNIGARPALDVQTRFDRKLLGLDGTKDVSALPLFRNIPRDAWIAKIEFGDLNAKGTDVAIESIELAHEGLELE